jgi:DNA-binding LacI/PurR family transcriptional regulator
MTTGQPLYLRIRDRIRAEILFGVNPGPGGRLPTERDLQLRFGVSRPTIAKALAALASKGEVLAAQGRGRFVPVREDGPAVAEPRARIGYVATIASETLTQRAFSGIERAARRLGFGVVMASANNLVEQEREAVNDLVASGARGIIVYPVPRPDPMPEPDYLQNGSIGVPIVLLDTALPEQGHTQLVFDNERACYQLTSWLIEHGHRRIAYAIGDMGLRHGPLVARIAGYEKALRDHGLQEDPSLAPHYHHGDRDAIRAICDDFARMEPGPTALIATDDMAAVECIERFAELGVRVPEDVYVAGFDDREETRRLKHQFSTTRPDFERMGESACEELVRLISGGTRPDRTFVYDVPLVIRRHGAIRAAD